MATSFSGGRSRSTQREPPTMGKQLVNFITCGCESSAPFYVIYKAGNEPTTVFEEFKHLRSRAPKKFFWCTTAEVLNFLKNDGKMFKYYKRFYDVSQFEKHNISYFCRKKQCYGMSACNQITVI